MLRGSRSAGDGDGHGRLTALPGRGEFPGSTRGFLGGFSQARAQVSPFLQGIGRVFIFQAPWRSVTRLSCLRVPALGMPRAEGRAGLPQPLEGPGAAVKPARGFAAERPAPEPRGERRESSRPRASAVALFAFSTADLMI